MRVLYAARRVAHPFVFGGAEWSAHETLMGLAQGGHRCQSLGDVGDRAPDLLQWMSSHPHRVNHQTVTHRRAKRCLPFLFEVNIDAGYPVRITLLCDFAAALRRIMREWRPSLVLTHLEGSEQVIQAAHEIGARIVHTVRDIHNAHNFTPYSSGWSRDIPFTTVATSDFLVHQVRERTGVDPVRIYPAVDVDRFARISGGNGDRVMMINPVTMKGEGILRHLVNALPEFEFTVVEGWERVGKGSWPYRNVQVMQRRLDLENVFAHAALLLVPSQAPEGFGRVVVEAQATGTPVLVSGHSGLAEACGDENALVQDWSNPIAWESAVKKVMVNKQYLSAQRERGRINSQRFSREAHVRALLAALDL